jgi:hypothetical protein
LFEGRRLPPPHPHLANEIMLLTPLDVEFYHKPLTQNGTLNIKRIEIHAIKCADFFVYIILLISIEIIYSLLEFHHIKSSTRESLRPQHASCM